MWQDGQDTNEEGVPVRLYQPILYSGRAAAAPTVSHVGGLPSYFPTDSVVNVDTPQCSSCKQNMYLLLQLYSPETERTLYVFGCNGGSCVASAFVRSSQFSLGGGGRFVCRRSQPDKSLKAIDDGMDSSKEAQAAESPWGSHEKSDNAENDWDVTVGDDDNIEDLEAMVTAMEMEGSRAKVERAKPTLPAPKSKTAPEAPSSLSTPSFPSFEIHSLQEPPARNSDDMDEDDVGMMEDSDAKIQQMLARYMAEEEDADIIAAIQGSTGYASGARGEKDERLPPEDRAMLAFTDRVKRAPRQVVRYAQGGVPLWSV